MPLSLPFVQHKDDIVLGRTGPFFFFPSYRLKEQDRATNFYHPGSCFAPFRGSYKIQKISSHHLFRGTTAPTSLMKHQAWWQLLKNRLSVRSALLDLVMYFFKLGSTAFGGPAAHIAMMHDGLVTRKKWLTDQEFLDLVSATNLIPGPNSTELAIHVGYRRAGWRGLIVAGVSFILPAMLIVMALAWAYVQFGTTPQADALFYGIQPVVIVIIAQALWLLGRKAVTNLVTAFVGIPALGLYLVGAPEILLLVVAGVVVMLIENAKHFKNIQPTLLLPFSLSPLLSMTVTTFSLPLLFFTFLKIGSVLYGSGYVLLAFLHDDFVQNLGWLTEKQLLDAVAIGQITPGPVFTTATFIGFILGGVPGAIVATVGIFLPAFVFVAISNPFIPRLRQSKMFSGLLDGVNVASAGLMAGVTLQLGQAAFVDLTTVSIALVTAVLLFRFKVNSTWLVAGGAAVGLLKAALKV
jgi:chromate transporter